MKFQINDIIEDLDVYCFGDNGPEKTKINKFLQGSKVLLIGVPGAFTPTCSEEHLPGYVRLKQSFFDKGIEKLIFISVNDPFVIKKWLDFNDASGIEFISDYDQNFLAKSGFKIDLSRIGLGMRLSRFAIVLNDGVITKIFDEDGAGLAESSAESVLEKL